MLTNQRVKKIDRNGIKDLERFTRKLYIYRQKDRPQDEGGNGKRKEKEDSKMLDHDKHIEAINLLYNNSLITEEEYDDIKNKIDKLNDHIAFVLTNNLEKDEARFF